MSLPDSFQFKAANASYSCPALYTASRNGDMWDVLWWDEKKMKIDFVDYTDEAVERNIRTGYWTIVAKEGEEKQPTLPAYFVFRHRDEPADLYAATLVQGYYEVVWGDGKSVYPQSWAEAYVKSGLWVIEDVANFGAQAVEFSGDEYDKVWIDEQLNDLKDDDEISDEALTFAYARRIARDLGAIVEIDQDFFTIRVGGVAYTATTAAQLVAIVSALDLLEGSIVG